MEGAKSTYSQSSDNGWSKFEEYAQQRGGVANFSVSRNPISPTAGRLHKEDMPIYGQEPATDKMMLVVCHICGRVVKSQALLKHKELYHFDGNSKGSPLVMSSNAFSLLPVQTHGQSSSTGYNSGKKNKECDFDRHCGVWIELDKKYCRKSITCKLHSLDQRQKVTGRSRPFAELLQEHKKMKKLKKMERLRTAVANNETTVPPLSSPSAMTSPTTHLSHRTVPQSPHPLSPLTPSSSRSLSQLMDASNSPLPSSIVSVYLCDSDKEDQDGPGDHEVSCNDDNGDGHLYSDPSITRGFYPKPTAVTSYYCRQTGDGFNTFSHRLDSIRSAFITLSGREKDFHTLPSTSSVIRQYNCSLKQKSVKRKYSYLGKQDHILLSRVAKKKDLINSNGRDSSPLPLTPPPSTTSTNPTINQLQSVIRTAPSAEPPLLYKDSLSQQHYGVFNNLSNDHQTRPQTHPQSNCVIMNVSKTSCDPPHLLSQQDGDAVYRRKQSVSYNSVDNFIKQEHIPNGLMSVPSSSSTPSSSSGSLSLQGPFSVNSSTANTYVINPSQHFMQRGGVLTIPPLQGNAPVNPLVMPPHNYHVPSSVHHHNQGMTFFPPLSHHHPPHHHNSPSMWLPSTNASTQLLNSPGNALYRQPAMDGNTYIHPLGSSGADMMSKNQYQSQQKYYIPPGVQTPFGVQSMTAGGLVQSPGPPPSDISNSTSPPHLHRLTPNGGNPSQFPSQTNLVVSSHNQRTQQVS